MKNIFLAGVLVSLLLASTLVIAKVGGYGYVTIPSRLQTKAVVPTPQVNVVYAQTIGTKNESALNPPHTLITRTTEVWQPVGTTDRIDGTMKKTCSSFFARVYARNTIANGYWDRLKARMTIRANSSVGKIPECAGIPEVVGAPGSVAENMSTIVNTTEPAPVEPVVVPAVTG